MALDDVAMMEAVAQEHPMRASVRPIPSWEGQTIVEIVRAANLDPRHGLPTVYLVRGTRADVVPMDLWGKVRPKRGTRVLVGYRVEASVAAIGAALISAAAPAIAGGFLGLTGFAYYATVAAITVVGGLIVNALVPPPPQPSTSSGGGERGRENFFVTGVQNQANKYGPYPKVLGRHRIYPPLSASGYTETTGSGGARFRARFAIGWGPVELLDMRLGDTPITEFEGVTVEFLNVDQSRTLSNISGLSSITHGWRTGTQRMRLYPQDITEEPHDILLDEGETASRFTAEDTEFAGVDILFKRGLINFNDKGDSFKRNAKYRFRYRPAEGGAWTDLGETTFRAKSQNAIRFTKEIEFPSAGRWEIEIKRTNFIDDSPEDQNTGWITAIRSRAAGRLPSHENIAEVAIRVQGSDQLAGQMNSFNCLVQQLAPVWNGSSWSAPQPVRHPAWVYADALRGPHIRRPVADTRIILDDLKAWADEEPHWTCDYVVDTETRLMDVLSVIAAAGRAKPALTDLRYSVIRDGANGSVRWPFTPRNSWGFKGSIKIPRAIHALRCQVRSERLNWEMDEVTVYADGFNAANATEFETMELPGVVLTSSNVNQSNPWRLGRYHLAQAIHRPESFEWHTDWEHLRFVRGDKVRIVHHVPLAGVGQGRIQEIERDPLDSSVLVAMTLDEAIDVESDDFRLTVWTYDGTGHEFTATSPADPYQRRWVRVSPEASIDASLISVGDLVTVEAVDEESLDVLITGIHPDAGETARITAVLAAPIVLQADQGTIPPYDPIVSSPRAPAVLGPPPPIIKQVTSDETTMERLRDDSVRARIGVLLEAEVLSGLSSTWVGLRWRETDSGQEWTYREETPLFGGVYLTGALVEGRPYDVEVATFGELGRSRGWVSAGSTLARALTAPPPDVTGFSVEPTVETEVRIKWEKPANTIDLDYVELRYSGTEGATWNASSSLDLVPYPTLSHREFARPGTYLARWVDGGGRKSVNVASVYVSEDEINALNVVETWEAHTDWSGTHTDTEVALGELGLVYDGGYPVEGVWESDEATDLGATYPVRIRPFIEARGVSQNDNVRSWGNIREVASVRIGDIEEWRVEIDVTASDSDPTGGDAWKPVGGGVVTGRYFRFRARLYSLRMDVTPLVSELTMVLDMPDRPEGDTEVTVPDTGLRVDFAPPYTALKSLNVTLNDEPSGARPVITGKSRTGFNITVRNSGGTAIEAVIDWQALGYGREIVAA